MWLNHKAVKRFCEEFYGYGLRKPQWLFIGIEEKDCNQIEEAKARLNFLNLKGVKPGILNCIHGLDNLN
jgi:hypothetical protein